MISRLLPSDLERPLALQLSKDLCICTALCALELNDDYLKGEAIAHSNRFVQNSPDNTRAYVVASTIKWALGHFEDAIADVTKMVEIAGKQGDTQGLIDGKNAFVYFVADWKSFQRKERGDWLVQAAEYVRELSSSAQQDQLKDTLGFHALVFGANRAEVERGRQLMLEAIPCITTNSAFSSSTTSMSRCESFLDSSKDKVIGRRGIAEVQSGGGRPKGAMPWLTGPKSKSPTSREVGLSLRNVGLARRRPHTHMNNLAKSMIYSPSTHRECILG